MLNNSNNNNNNFSRNHADCHVSLSGKAAQHTRTRVALIFLVPNSWHSSKTFRGYRRILSHSSRITRYVHTGRLRFDKPPPRAFFSIPFFISAFAAGVCNTRENPQRSPLFRVPRLRELFPGLVFCALLLMIFPHFRSPSTRGKRSPRNDILPEHLFLNRLLAVLQQSCPCQSASRAPP